MHMTDLAEFPFNGQNDVDLKNETKKKMRKALKWMTKKLGAVFFQSHTQCYFWAERKKQEE